MLVLNELVTFVRTIINLLRKHGDLFLGFRTRNGSTNRLQAPGNPFHASGTAFEAADKYFCPRSWHDLAKPDETPRNDVYNKALGGRRGAADCRGSALSVIANL